MSFKLSFRIGLKRKLLIPMLTTVFVGMLFVVINSYRETKKYIQELAETQLEAITSATSASLSEYILLNRKLNLSWSESNFVIDAAGGDSKKAVQASERLKYLQTQFDAIDSIFITDASGMTISSTAEDSIGKVNISDRDYFRQVMAKGEPALSDEVTSKATGEPIFVVASPVKKDGKVLGVIGTTVQLKAMAEKNN